MKYECGIILLILGSCWGSALHPEINSELQNDSQRGRLRAGPYVVEAQSCPTWYRETKHNPVTRCVCGDTIEGFVVCDYATQKSLQAYV